MRQLPNPRNLLSQQTRTSGIKAAFHQIETPAYIFDLKLLKDNLQFLEQLAKKLDVKIIFAQKSYSLYSTYPLISKYLSGSTASGLYEAQLAREEFPGEIHVYSPAYKTDDVIKLLEFVDYIYFNSFSQWQKYLVLINQAKKSGRKIQVGLRVNPEYSETEHDIYNPAGRYSRLGITAQAFEQGVAEYGLEGIDGLHFHALCEENANSLANVLTNFENKFSPYIEKMTWLNFGGGHLFTRADYQVELLAEILHDFRLKYPNQTIYFEPGEAISLDTGFLVCEVLDIVQNEVNIAIVDTSATCHMPDVLEMPYTPRVFLLDEKYSEEGYYIEAEAINDEALINKEFIKDNNVFRLGAPTCLAGDIIGNYKFPRPLQQQDRLVFCDMALYAHVKTNTFNGMPLPNLVTLQSAENYKVERQATYFDFKNRLGNMTLRQD
ncbi:MAG TPA: carboxynorspermidine decarboxylase [Clostridiaceae bacterium]|nr:carboxynorspermidine decarboxylase [Clostridiaceae bacterium]